MNFFAFNVKFLTSVVLLSTLSLIGLANIVIKQPTDVQNISNDLSDDLLKTALVNRDLATNSSASFPFHLVTFGQLYRVRADDIGDGSKTLYTSSLIKVVIGPFVKLQILLPGESNVPNTSSGKTGTPFFGTPPLAGAKFNVTVNAVDANWNVISTVNDMVAVTGVTANYGASSSIPPNKALSNGTAEFEITLNRAATNHEMRATDLTDFTKTAVTSSIFSVSARPFSQLQILLPNETAEPGTPTGKAGMATPRTAGVPFLVTVNAVDSLWNQVVTATPTVAISTPDANASIPPNATLAGTINFNVTLRTIEMTTVTATEISLGNTSVTSSSVSVVSGGFAKLQILLDGETAAPGTVTGKTRNTVARVSGTPFEITVNAVDAAWNLMSSVTDVVRLTSSDANAAMPADLRLENGTQKFSVTLITAGSKTITAHDVSDGSKTQDVSSTFTLGAGAYSKILILLPGQNNAVGTVTGISGNPIIPPNGNAFFMRVRAVDQYFNPVSGITNLIRFEKSSTLDIISPSPSNFVTNNFSNISTTINTPGLQTVTLIDDVTGYYVVVNILGSTALSAQADHFRSVVSGIWGDTATWESSMNGSTDWKPATLVPDSGSATITVQKTHVVEVAASITVDQVTIAAGGELVVNNGNLTIADGADPIDLLVNGILTGDNGGLITSTGNTTLTSGAKYQHKYTTSNGRIPASTWASGSVCEVVGYTSFAGTINGGNQNFATLNWNCPNQNNANDGPALGASFKAQHLNIITTGRGMLYLGSSAGSSTISGNLKLTMGKVAITRSGNKTINIAGNLILEDGFLERGVANATVNFIGNQQFVNTRTVLLGAINFALTNAATVDFGTSVLNGTSGNFTVNSGATLITANVDGIAATGAYTGSIQNTGIRTYGAGSYIFNGSTAQNTGTGLPTTVNNLTITNINGVSLPSGTTPYTVNGILTVNTNSFLDLRGHPLAGSFSNIGAGTLRTQAASAFMTGKTWNVGIEYDGDVMQNIISGTYYGLLATSGTGIKTGPAGTLNVAGDWSSAGGKVDFNTNNTLLTFNGTGAQTIADQGSNGGQGIEFQYVNFSGGGAKSFTAGNFSLNATATLTLGVNTTLNANGKLTVLSNATSTGTIAAIPSSSEITGNVTVQRFLTGGSAAHRTYRMFSSPIHEINAGERRYSFMQFADDMIISGGAGFYATPTNSPSAWTYDAAVAGDKYVPIASLSTSLKIGEGAYLFYRGDKINNLASKVTPPFAIPESFPMTFTGVLNQQEVSVSLKSGFNLVGNPYASSINWNSSAISKTLQNNIFRIWDPSTRTYASYNGDIGNPVSINNIIPAGQGFFVQSDAGGTLIFREGAKVNSQPTQFLMSSPTGNDLADIGTRKVAVGGTAAALANLTLRTELRLALKRADLAYKVESAVILQEGRIAEYKLGDDVNYITATGEFGTEVFLSTLSADARKMAINYLPEVGATTTVRLDLDTKNAVGKYSLQINAVNLPSGYLLRLNDGYLKTSQLIANGDTYSFSINALKQSAGVDRFSLSFESQATLPVTYSSFSAVKVKEGVLLKWRTQTETNNNRFEVERAGNDKVFLKLRSILSKVEGSDYSFTDRNPLIGNNYYRLAQIDNNNKLTRNEPQVVYYTGGINADETGVNIFPNPVAANFTVKYNGVLTSDKQLLKVVNASGQVSLTKVVTKKALREGYEINISNYAVGVYVLEVYDGEYKLAQQTKFIKH